MSFYDVKGFSNTDEVTKIEHSIPKENDKPFRWSFDISNIVKYDEEDFIFVAVSYINIEEDMKGIEKGTEKEWVKVRYEKIELNRQDSIKRKNNHPPENTAVNISQKGTAIYCLKLKDPMNETAKESYEVDENFILYGLNNNFSGICKFIGSNENNDDMAQNPTTEDDDDLDCILKRFILLNTNGIYSFEYNKDNKSFNLNDRFHYPKITKNELKNKKKYPDYMGRLLSCIYNEYFLVKHYENNIQFLEGIVLISFFF